MREPYAAQYESTARRRYHGPVWTPRPRTAILRSRRACHPYRSVTDPGSRGTSHPPIVVGVRRHLRRPGGARHRPAACVGLPAPSISLIAALVLGVGLAAIEHRTAVADLEAGQRAEAESFVRILSNLTHSVSPDAVVAAIIDELARATGADHIVVARRRPTPGSSRPGSSARGRASPTSTTTLPIGDLEDPLADAAGTPRRDPVAIPVLRETLEPIPAAAGLAVGVRGFVGGVATRLAAGPTTGPLRRTRLRSSSRSGRPQTSSGSPTGSPHGPGRSTA